MSSFDTTRHYTTAHAANRLGLVIVTALQSLTQWYARRQTRKLLSALSDRELDDIGLGRSEITRISRQG